MVLNIAHRGGAGLAPENTIACFKQGILYADMIEFDVQPTIDHRLMVFHDRNNIERTTNGHGQISESTFDYLRSLDAGSWFNFLYQGEKIPTLTEVLTFLPPSILINLELKYHDPDTDWFEQSVVNIIQKYKIDHRTVITARYPENITRLKIIDSSLKLALLQKGRDKENYFKMLIDYGLHTAQIRKSALTHQFIQDCHGNDIQVFYFYADEIIHMQQAIDVGVDGILTNYPDTLRTLLDEKNK
jgi:glycerophosphoryl diester phosphodiesterase